MLTPEQAVAEMRKRGLHRPNEGMDDPTEAGLAYRWWWNEDGVLCSSYWRGAATVHVAHTLTIPILVHCLWCHKTHAASPGETPCAPGAWIEDATGLRFEAAERVRAENARG